MKKYEYIEQIRTGYIQYNNEHKRDPISMQTYMNMLGQQGWEIFSDGFARREIEPEIIVKKSIEIER